MSLRVVPLRSKNSSLLPNVEMKARLKPSSTATSEGLVPPNALVSTGLAAFRVVSYTEVISKRVVGNEGMLPAFLRRVTVAIYPERNNLTRS
jgi:hypothetical protein